MKRAMIMLGLLLSGTAWGAPLSDLAQDLFDKGPAALSPLQRSPFMPASPSSSSIDIGTLQVHGIIFGKKIKLALVSGRIVREQDTLGSATVETIAADQVALTAETGRIVLKLANYVKPGAEATTGNYSVEFEDADLKDALTMLAKGAELNIIMPEDIAGRVSVSFAETSLKEALQSILRVNGFEYAMESGIVRVGRPDAFAGGTDLKTQHFRLKYANAKDLVDKIKPLLSDRGAVIAEERTNTLIVKDRDSLVASVSQFIGQVDQRDQQVEIQAEIVDASRNFSRSLGVRWGGSGTKGDVKVGGSADIGTGRDNNNLLNVNTGVSNPTSGLAIVVGKLASDNLVAQLTAAEKDGEIKILSKPGVTTLNNMPAKIRSGTKIYVKSTSSISVGTAGGTGATGATGGLQEINTGIDLTVTPQISTENFIKLVIDVVESEADFSRTVDGIPAVLDNTATTTVLLKNGETTVIGGLYKNKTTREQNGVPGLQKIPLFGNLFRSKTRTTADTELMIFITPRIIRF